MKLIFIIIALIAAVVGGRYVVQAPSDATNSDMESQNIEQSSPATQTTTAPTPGSIEVYAGIYVPRDAETLDLSGRGLTGSLKAEVRQLTELQVLNLSNNSFTGLPAEVGQLSHLRVLNLSNNPLTGLPYELGNLSRLQTLILSGTSYSTADMEVIAEKLPSTVHIITTNE